MKRSVNRRAVTRLLELTVRRRVVVALALAVMLTTVGILLVQAARAWAFAADRHRRAQEMTAREVGLQKQLSDREAVLESQRRIYTQRLWRLEAQVRQRDEAIAELRTLLPPALDPDSLSGAAQH